MATQAELIEIFRKANEDLTQANVRNIYKAKFGTSELVVGDNVIEIPVLTVDEAYADPDEYLIRFYKAVEIVDEEEIDISAALVVTNKTAVSFTVSSPVIGTLQWEIFLKYPNFHFWT